MAITQAMCTSFKVELLGAVHDFDSVTGDTFKIALFTEDADLGAATTTYSATNETSGTGYTAGGVDLVLTIDPTAGGTTAYVDFENAVWADATISAAGALIYNSTKGNTAVAVLSFGGTVSATAGAFTVQFPAAGASTAILRIA